MSPQRIKTPCVGLCFTVYGDLVCRGCRRFHHEVINWNPYDVEEKWATWSHLRQLLVQMMAAKLEVFSAARLHPQLEQRRIHFVPEQSPYRWAYQSIARGSWLINQIEAYGVALLSEFRGWSLPNLRDAIDRGLFLLSEARYQYYTAPSFLQTIDKQAVSPAKKPPSGGFFIQPMVASCWPVPPGGR